MRTRLFPRLTIYFCALTLLCILPAGATPPPASDEQAFLASVERLAIQSLIRTGAWEELYTRSVSGLNTAPTDPVLLRGKVRALRQLGYGPAARKTLQQARASHPDDPELLLEQVWLASIAGDWQQVLRDTTTVTKQTDADNEFFLLRGIALRETGQSDAAIEQFSLLLGRKQNDCVALTNRGRLLASSRGKETQALADLTAAAACKDQPEPLLARGTLLLRLGRVSEAVADLDKGLALAPTNMSGLLARSEARFLLGDIEGAAQDLMVARQVNPDDRRIEPLSCRVAASTGDWAIVVACAEQTTNATPNDPAAWRTLAKARLESGNLDGAVAAYDTLVKLSDSDPRARLERATVQILRRDYPAAVADCSLVIEKHPLATAYALRSLAHFKAGKIAQADEDSTNALVLDRNEQTAILVRANVALSRNELAAATADCERVLQRNQKSSWGAITCGKAHLQAGDLKKASLYAEQAQKLAPADPDTKELLAGLSAARPNDNAVAPPQSTPPAKENEVAP